MHQKHRLVIFVAICFAKTWRGLLKIRLPAAAYQNRGIRHELCIAISHQNSTPRMGKLQGRNTVRGRQHDRLVKSAIDHQPPLIGNVH